MYTEVQFFILAIYRYRSKMIVHLFSPMTLRSYILASVIILSGCSLSDQDTPPIVSTGSIVQTGMIDSGTVDHQPPLVEDLSGSGDAYYPIFQWLESRTIRVKHTSWVKTKIAFINSEATSLHAVVSYASGTTGNLRLSQIVMPDGTMDGPFGSDTTIGLTQFGGYELLYHENMMAGDPWSGEALITITLK